ncbi:MAG: presqualene diphosphate synthase HpnD [Gammaproteobacteria bacterium]
MTPEAYCEHKAAKSGSSFYYSFLFLSPEKRQAMMALYAFCREVDDIVDESTDKSVARHQMKWWSEEINRLFEGTPQHPITRALKPHLATLKWEQQWFKDVLYGMRMDLEHPLYENFEDLEQYCYYVAGVVGILSAYLFGFKSENTLTFAKNLGIALQLINIIRDLREDAIRGRVYIPESDLKISGLTPSDILNQTASQAGLEKTLQLMATRAKNYFQKAFDALPEADRYAQISGIIMGQIYIELLKIIEDSGFKVMTHRISLTPIKKLWIAWKTFRQEKKRFRRYQRRQTSHHVAA